MIESIYNFILSDPGTILFALLFVGAFIMCLIESAIEKIGEKITKENKLYSRREVFWEKYQETF